VILFKCPQLLVLMLVWTVLAFLQGCQIDEGRDPDKAPDNGLNPGTSPAGERPAKQRGPINPGVTEQCIFELAGAPFENGGGGAELSVVAAEGAELARVLISDPRAMVFLRATLPILEAGLYTIEVTDAAGASCYAEIEVESIDQNIKVTVAS
jgi:hypothetical protein